MKTESAKNNMTNVNSLKLKMIRRLSISCPLCGSAAVEYHYSDFSIRITCYGHCGYDAKI